MVRSSSLGVRYKGVDIVDDNAQNRLTSFSFTDNASGAADDISVELSDRNRDFLDRWKIQQGDEILPIIYTHNWKFDGDFREKNCGTFFIDTPTILGMPRKVSLNASSAPISTSLKAPETRVWNNISLDKIAKDIATKHNMGLFFDSNDARFYGALKQDKRPDSEFLQKLCEEAAHGFKIRSNNIVIYDMIKYMKKDAVLDIWEGTQIPELTMPQSYNIATGYSFSFGDDSNYDAVNVTYRNTSKNKTIRGRFIRPNNSGWKVFELEDSYVSSVADANFLARRKLFQLNKEAVKCSISIMGDVCYSAGTCINLKGFGLYSGKYFVERVRHEKSSGYTCELELFKAFDI